ncbi:MAG: AcvB/VirJ family lysyl-phosphatidylglycerol hydrolase [Vicinamibacteria bacterium]
MKTSTGTIVLAAGLTAFGVAVAEASSERTVMLDLRGQSQTLHLYGAPGPRVAVVTSGDGGWLGLGRDVAEHLADAGWFVAGFDAKAYLSSFTHGDRTLCVGDVPRDYAALVDYAARGAQAKPVLFGVSEGAGLSVLAATDPAVQAKVAGVVAMGLPDQNELGWRFRDQMIYITKKTPNEPLFSVRQIVGSVAPLPLAIFQATHDEFVPADDTRAIAAAAREPRRLWTIEAGNHRFGDARPELWRRLEEALAWIAQAPASR